MIQKLKSFKNSYITYAVLFVITLILIGVSVSFAYMRVNTNNFSTTSTIDVALECMDITYSETNRIELNYNYPVEDEYALENITPVSITVTNNCTTDINMDTNYTLAVTSLFNDDGYIMDDQIKIQVKRTLPDDEPFRIRPIMFLNEIEELSNTNTINHLIEDMTYKGSIDSYDDSNTYVIDSNVIYGGETITYDVWLWVDYYEGDLTRTGKNNNSTQGKQFDAAISLIVNDELHDITIGEAYAIYTDINSTLTFIRSDFSMEDEDYFNDLQITALYSGFEETLYDWSEVPWYDYSSEIVHVVFEDEIRPISTVSWFESFYNIEDINLDMIDTRKVCDMRGMFQYTHMVDVDMDLTGWDVSNVTNMDSMFYASSWYSLDTSGWDTSNVTNMGWMFCLEEGHYSGDVPIGIEDWDVSNVTSMAYMFYMIPWESIDLSNWDVSSATDMSGMFGDSGSLRYVGDISSWDVSNVTNMAYMFCWTVIENLNLDDWDVSNVIDMTYLFAGVQTTEFGDLSCWDVSNVTNMYGMFSNSICASQDLQAWDVSSVMDMSFMFEGAYLSDMSDISGWDTSNVTSMAYMFNNAFDAPIMDLSGWDVWNVSWYEEFENDDRIVPPIWEPHNLG